MDGPRGSRLARPSPLLARVGTPFVRQVTQHRGKSGAHGVARADDEIAHEKPDREHGAEQRRPANDLLAPGIPEGAHGRSRRGTQHNAGPTGVGEVGFLPRELGVGTEGGWGPPRTLKRWRGPSFARILRTA